ncbi:uncharacterized protein LDX57_002853 [Aspergillus melleus]|uniref:uncharacterized protein n=1 Tax=Aspergillus melleus TaxID=138277 RepID=UPI001E8DA04E|nr:uncharacterized protein LDX57_002853 [Aspergillus melleus]KAH8425104.1 hypothetical protein LDX57_002853 [Aspergillus melleus]
MLFGDLYVDQLKGVQQYGADFHTVNTVGETLLHLAARIPWHDDTDANGFSFDVILSGNHGDYSVAAFKCLMDMGLDPFQEDYDQRTPLVVTAAAYSKDEIVALFRTKSGEVDICPGIST